MDSDVIKIEIGIYRRCNNLPEHDISFQGTHHFDEECGLLFHSNKAGRAQGHFYFEVIDKHKYFLAKIKYGI